MNPSRLEHYRYRRGRILESASNPFLLTQKFYGTAIDLAKLQRGMVWQSEASVPEGNVEPVGTRPLGVELLRQQEVAVAVPAPQQGPQVVISEKHHTQSSF